MTISAPERIHGAVQTHKLPVHLGDSRIGADRFLHAFGPNEERNKKQGKQNKSQTSSNSLGEHLRTDLQKPPVKATSN